MGQRGGHGLRAEKYVLLPDEDAAEFAGFEDAAEFADLAPADARLLGDFGGRPREPGAQAVLALGSRLPDG